MEEDEALHMQGMIVLPLEDESVAHFAVFVFVFKWHLLQSEENEG